MCSYKKLSNHCSSVPACVTTEPLGPVTGAVSTELAACPERSPCLSLSQHSPAGKALQLGKGQAGLSAEGRRRGNDEGNSLREAEQKRPFDLTNG